MRRFPCRPARGLALVLLLAAGPLAAQPLTIPRFDFSFSNPGARSLGFGGAFAALADDATAAYANPAGLVQLTRPEVSFEARLRRRSPSFIAGGRIEGTPTGEGLDTTQGLVFHHDHSQGLGASFAAVVLPRGRWSFVFYGHELADFQEKALSQGFFFTDGRSLPTRESVDLAIPTGGMAAAWRLDDHWSFGLGLVLSRVSLTTRSEAFLPDGESLALLFTGRSFGGSSFPPEQRISTTTLDFHGTDLTGTAGALWRVSEQTSAGLFYRQGARVRGTADVISGPALPLPSPVASTTSAVFKVPDVTGLGLAHRSQSGRVTVTGEVDHVGYSGLVKIKNTDELDIGSREYLDAWEYHLGAEYALLQSTPIVAFRAGGWVEANGDDVRQRRLTHLSAGVGLAARAWQIDLAGDFSSEGDSVSLSLLYAF
ncbi:MAG TPA: outer membrane protein transport protein [Thermoanaerobaculia bacterium]|nr:outer membrane protein transport protein [Thermoanaerobaculia bacterium]